MTELKTKKFFWLVSAASAALLVACNPPATYEPAPESEPVVEIAESETGVHDEEIHEHEEAEETEEPGHEDEHHEEADPADHDHDEDHDHEDHGEEEHADYDHDHEDHDHAGGTAHVHGVADLAVTLDEHFVTVSLESPLANFGMSEADDYNKEEIDVLTEGVAELLGDARCDLTEHAAVLRTDTGHKDVSVSIVWDCFRPSRLDGLKFTGFETYSGFETINAVYLSGTDQEAATLTPDDPVIPFN